MPLDQDQFRAIVSGRRDDVWARVARIWLGIAALGYRLVVSVRNCLYDYHLLKAHKADTPVVCVGNLTTGGTGKTPLVIWLARLLTDRKVRIAVLTRGYKTAKTDSRGRRTEDEVRRVCTAHQQEKVGDAHPTNGDERSVKGSPLSDEPAELASACPGVPVIVNADRVAGAAEAIGAHRAQVLVMDDGFQHRRLARDLDIVTIDATVPFGYGRLLPAGLLREPTGALVRAKAVVLTRCDLVSEHTVSEIEAQILQINPDLVLARTIHAPVGLCYADGSRHALDELRGKRVFAFCGLGNPASFRRSVEACGCELVGSRCFNDHHVYTEADLTAIQNEAVAQSAELLLTSQKDWTKIGTLPYSARQPVLAYLTVELRFTAGRESVTALIEQMLSGTMPRS